MAELLVSVRSVQEAEAALAGGADLIDVKAPERGSLGRPDQDTVRAILAVVAGRRPVSAALGELAETPEPFANLPLAFAKWGLAGLRTDWRAVLEPARQRFHASMPRCRLIIAVYADWQRARAPSLEEIGSWVCTQPAVGLLLDTWSKDGSSLLDWVTLPILQHLAKDCRAAGTPLALAGSLDGRRIAQLRELDPDWFAVRGAACRDGNRGAAIDPAAVAELAQLLRLPARAQVESETTATGTQHLRERRIDQAKTGRGGSSSHRD